MVKSGATFWLYSISSFEVFDEVFLNHVCSKIVFCKGVSIFTAYLCVLVKLMSLLQFSDDLEQKENGFNHLGEEAESKIKQCITNSSLRSILRPGKGGLFELSCNHGHLNVVKWLYRYFVGYNIDIYEVSCIYGKLKVAKWLYFDVDYVFASCYENGTLEAVHQLYSLGNFDIMLMMIQHLEAVVVVLNIIMQNGYVNYVMVTQFLLKMIKSLNMGLEHTLAGK